MNSIIRNFIAVGAGAILGSAVNMSIIMVSGSVIPPPAGADVMTAEGLKASMHLFRPEHFLMPFLAHALGTFAGAYLAAVVAASYKTLFAYVIGVLFLTGGIANVLILPSPVWFSVVDLVGAYIPMAYFAGKLAVKKQ